MMYLSEKSQLLTGWFILSKENLLVGLIAALTSVLTTSCQEIGSKDDWRYDGLQKIPIDSVIVPDTITTTDTLYIGFWSGAIDGRPEFSDFDITRDSIHAEITAWANVYTWIGDGPMPPTCLHPLQGDTCRVSPPFYSGEFQVVIRQPDDSTIMEMVTVVQ